MQQCAGEVTVEGGKACLIVMRHRSDLWGYVLAGVYIPSK